jgi:uncharacterized protein
MPFVPNSRVIEASPPGRDGPPYKTHKGYPGRAGSPAVSGPRWIADEMVGHLARYLRFVGCDTEYVRGLADDEIVVRASAERRVLVTRDRALARRVPGAILLTSLAVEGQWRELRSACPELPTEVRFERCTECNGALRPATPAERADEGAGLPPAVRAGASPLYRCEACGHAYWDGTHSRDVRERLRRWSAIA